MNEPENFEGSIRLQIGHQAVERNSETGVLETGIRHNANTLQEIKLVKEAIDHVGIRGGLGDPVNMWSFTLRGKAVDRDAFDEHGVVHWQWVMKSS